MMKALMLLPTLLLSLAFTNLPKVNEPPVIKAGKIIKAAELFPPGYEIKTVVIDPGHGGHDPGCSGAHSKEKHLCLAMGKLVAQAIEQNYPDVKVIMTRSTDKFIPLNERANIATRNKADLFISIHCNWVGAPKIAGTETYVLGLHATEANLAVAKRENESILLEENYQETYGYDPNSPEAHIMMSMFQNAFIEQSAAFAKKVQEQSNAQAQRRNIGVKQAGFLVLRHATMPSVLIEAGFLSNGSEERFLRSGSGQKRMANAILMAFHEYKMEMEGKSGLPKPKLLELETEESEPTDDPVAKEEKPQDELTASNEPVFLPVKNELPKEDKPLPKEKKNIKPSLPFDDSKAQQGEAWQGPKTEVPASVQEQKREKQQPSPPKREPLKETPSKILPSVEVATETVSAKPQPAEVQYRVQLAASPELIDINRGAWPKVDYLIEIVEEDGKYKYQLRNFASLDEALAAQKKVRALGFKDAFVATYQNGRRVK